MTNSIEKLNAIETSNKSAKSAIKLAVARITENASMTTRAQSLVVTFCTVAANSDLDFDSNIVNANVYAIEKAKKYIQALTQKSVTALDKYTQAISVNMLKRKSTKTMSNAEFNASLCNALECDTMTATMTKLHKAESTALTQASSTRVALNAMNIATHNRDEKTSKFNDNDVAKAFIELFSKK